MAPNPFRLPATARRGLEPPRREASVVLVHECSWRHDLVDRVERRRVQTHVGTRQQVIELLDPSAAR